MERGQRPLENMELDQRFFQGRSVLITGNCGFKGSWLSHWLLSMGAKVSGLSQKQEAHHCLFTQLNLSERMQTTWADVSNQGAVLECVQSIQPELIFHLAAQSLVIEGYLNPVTTFASNIMGTVHILEAARQTASVQSVIVVTSDKVYEASNEAHSEGDALGGSDPYSTSKACAELISNCYNAAFCNSPTPGERQLKIATVRAGNVIGGGDFSPNRLIPDIVEAWFLGQSVQLRNPEALRPWQHVLDALHGYLLLAQYELNASTAKGGEGQKSPNHAWNIGPLQEDELTVQRVVELMAQSWDSEAKYHFSEGQWAETTTLRINSEKAQVHLGWKPRWTAQKSILETSYWYQKQSQGMCAKKLCDSQISAFLEAVYPATTLHPEECSKHGDL